MVSASSNAITCGWPNFNPGAFLPAFGDGRLHHFLDAVAAHATVVADTFDFQQAPIDLAAELLQVCRYVRFLKPLFTPKSFTFRNVPSVRQPRPSLKYCFKSKSLYSVCRLGMYAVLD